MEIFKGFDGFEKFADYVHMRDQDRKLRKKLLTKSYMPFMVTKYFASVIKDESEPRKTQLLNIVLPYDGKSNFSGRFDPYGNKSYRENSEYFIQHKYESTLLLHMYDFCISNCQFCYKVNEIRHEDKVGINLNKKIDAALEYLDNHPEVDNILFSGGDPAAIKQSSLIECISRLIEHKNIRVVRFATKVLAYDPNYFTDERLLAFFKKINDKDHKQITIIAQINHPAEISKDVIKSIKLLQKSGVQLRGQPAIAQGINNDVEVLTELLRNYIDNQIIPYYLTVFMPVRGVEQYGIKLHEAFANMKNAKRQINGLEKKGVLVASHDFGKLEICGFYPNLEEPKKIILKWHQAAMSKYLPEILKKKISCKPEDILMLNYDTKNIYCIDHLFEYNELPYFDTNGNLTQ